jgi:hypothetical protein
VDHRVRIPGLRELHRQARQPDRDAFASFLDPIGRAEWNCLSKAHADRYNSRALSLIDKPRSAPSVCPLSRERRGGGAVCEQLHVLRSQFRGLGYPADQVLRSAIGSLLLRMAVLRNSAILARLTSLRTAIPTALSDHTRVRGRPDRPTRRGVECRTTPADAGTTAATGRLSHRRPDHPRGCGDGH